MVVIDVTLPKKLYRYSERRWLERSLTHGEFRLRPASDYALEERSKARHDNELRRSFALPGATVTVAATGQKLKTKGDVMFESRMNSDYLTLCLASQWAPHLFNDFEGSDACLVIHDPEKFRSRMNAASSSALPEWIGVDGPVTYGHDSPLGVPFIKSLQFSFQFEWRFVWVHPTARACRPVTISLGNLQDIAELVDAPVDPAPNNTLQPTGHASGAAGG